MTQQSEKQTQLSPAAEVGQLAVETELRRVNRQHNSGSLQQATMLGLIDSLNLVTLEYFTQLRKLNERYRGDIETLIGRRE